jgi:site-specific recombinase XerD
MTSRCSKGVPRFAKRGPPPTDAFGALAKIIKRTAERAPLPANVKAMVSPHWLRHARASHALDNGAPISLVQQTLGHGNIRTTSIYAHAKPGDSSALYLKKLR